MLCRRSWLSVIFTILLLLEIVLNVESYNYNGYKYNGSYRNRNNNDDAGQQQADDYEYYKYKNGNDENNGYYVGDDWASNQVLNDDDEFTWNSNVGFEGVSVMPVSCIN